MPKKNKISDLRDHLFESIEMLKDGEMEVKTAQAIRSLGDTIVNSAKVELDFMKQTGQLESDFLPNTGKQLKPAPNAEVPDCKCGDPIYPDDIERSERMGLNYPRCKSCLSVLPKKLDTDKANGLVN